MTKTYEDIEEGDSWEFGAYEVDREEIIEFAEGYDPQPIHVNEDAARDSFFNGLVASGWHTASMAMRLVVDNLLDEHNVIGATGVDALRWHEPVRPGDELRVRMEVIGKERWDESKGAVRFNQEVKREDGTVVMSLEPNVLFRRS
jgi:acyl dehydratase